MATVEIVSLSYRNRDAANGYRLWSPEKMKILIARDVVFDEILNTIESIDDDEGCFC